MVSHSCSFGVVVVVGGGGGDGGLMVAVVGGGGLWCCFLLSDLGSKRGWFQLQYFKFVTTNCYAGMVPD